VSRHIVMSSSTVREQVKVYYAVCLEGCSCQQCPYSSAHQRSTQQALQLAMQCVQQRTDMCPRAGARDIRLLPINTLQTLVAALFADPSLIKQHAMLSKQHLVDYAQLHQLILTVQTHTQLAHTLSQAVQHSLQLIHTHYNSQTHTNLREIIILLAMPLFQDPTDENNLNTLCLTINSLNQTHLDILANHLTNIPTEEFEKIITTMQD
jgi:hypothetical protein